MFPDGYGFKIGLLVRGTGFLRKLNGYGYGLISKTLLRKRNRYGLTQISMTGTESVPVPVLRSMA